MSMGGNFIKYLKAVVKSMYKDDKIIEVNHIAGYSINEDVKKLFQLIVSLVMNTDYFKKETKAVLMGSSYRNSGDTSANINTVKSKVGYDLSKLTKVLGADFFENVLQKQSIDLSNYYKKIRQLLETTRKKSVLDVLIIKLPECSGSEVNCINQENWMFLLGVFLQYSKASVHSVEKQLTEEMVDYIHYLENNPDCLNEVQQKHYDIILQSFEK